MNSCQLLEASKGTAQFSPIGCELFYLIFVYEKQAWLMVMMKTRLQLQASAASAMTFLWCKNEIRR